ncbi:MAG: hypothetical protein ACRD22_21850 [Terriglobia bacterium]
MSEEEQKKNEAETIDINELADDGVAEELNLAANAYDAAPPVPDKKWVAQLQEVDPQKFQRKKSKNGVEFFFTNVVLKIVAPEDAKSDGTPIYTTVSTMVFGRSGTSSMATLANAAGAQLPGTVTPLQQCRALMEASRSTPLVEIETQWEAFAQHDEGKGAKPKQFRKKKMVNFPKDKDGVPVPETETPWGEIVEAQSRLARVSAIKREG